MATYDFSALHDGDVLAFKPTQDILKFNLIGGAPGTVRYQASSVIASETSAGLALTYPDYVSGTTVIVPGKTIILAGMSLDQIASSGRDGGGNPIFANIIFGDVASQNGVLFVGDDTASTHGTGSPDYGTFHLVGTSFNDQLIALGLAGTTDTLDGRDGDDLLTGGAGNDNLYGGNGNDTLYGGKGDDRLEGEAGADKLYGGDGNDFLDGGALADYMNGGNGNDTYIVDNIGDVVVEDIADPALGGIDKVITSVNYTLPGAVENLTLADQPLPSPTSTIDDINGFGNTLNNTIIGNSGFNLIDGGSGADTMQGLAIPNPNAKKGENPYFADGGDTYIVDNVNDKVVEYSNVNNPANDGINPRYILIDWIDTIRSSVSYALPNYIEILQLTGTADLAGTGNSLDNIIYANAGNNKLDGGSDSLTSTPATATPGLDEYGFVSGDTVSYQLGSTGGVNISLAVTADQDTGGSGIDNLTGFENLTGSPYNDTLTGNSGPNVLNGGADLRNFSGDSGADVLTGGDGNDTYVVDGNDTVIETNANAATGGVDWVYTWVNYRLPANVEDLRAFPLTGVYPAPKSYDINLTGNTLNNVIIGNNANNSTGGNNVLDGGAGADYMAGGTGNDTYVVDNNSTKVTLLVDGVPKLITGDTIVEDVSAGIDLVQSSVSYTLTANVENLQLTGLGNINATGNALSNILGANRGDNVINGSSGNDTVSYLYGAGKIVAGHYGPGVQVDLSKQNVAQDTGGSGKDTLINIANLIGSSYDDYITPDNGNNVLDGGLGIDTVSYSYANGPVTVDLTAGKATGGGGADTVINFENVIGGKDSDFLQGTLGNNVLDGGSSGVDTVSYEKSATYGVNVDLSVATQQNTGGSGFDTLKSIENLIGSPYDDRLTGNAGSNLLNGGLGADTLTGGNGDDTYVVDNTGDLVVETNASSATGGIDTVQSSVTYTLSANVEYLQLTGSANINGTGNTLPNLLTGNSGGNILSGGGGADYMAGGGGNDTYIVDDNSTVANVNGTPITGDTISESANAGTDLVVSTVDYVLPKNVENLQLSGIHANNGTGNDANNVISGTPANNVLDGGAGVDTVSYLNGAATAGVTIDLNKQGAGQATGGSGADTLVNFENVTGSIYNDILIGTPGNNVLTGSTGLDKLTGSLGADTFVYAAASDSPAGSARDVIMDFSTADKDKIDVSQFDSNLSSSGLQHWTLVAGPATAAGQMTFNAATHILSFDQQTGPSTSDHGIVAEIQLNGVTSLLSSDFILS